MHIKSIKIQWIQNLRLQDLVEGLDDFGLKIEVPHLLKQG